MSLASAVSNYGMANALIASLSRLCWAMAKEEGKSRKLPSIIAHSYTKSNGEVVPIGALLFAGCVSSVLTRFSFALLVEVTTILRVVNIVLQFASLIALKYLEPFTERPFVVVGGTLGAWLISLPTFIISALLVTNAPWDVGLIAVAVNAVIIAMYFVRLTFFALWPTSSQDNLSCQ